MSTSYTMTPRQRQALVEFALDVLAGLETDTAWSADTLATLADGAEVRGLARTDRDGQFRVANPFRRAAGVLASQRAE